MGKKFVNDKKQQKKQKKLSEIEEKGENEMKKENKTKRTWLKSNRNSLIALALLIIVVIGSTFTSSWYDNSGTLETSLGEGSLIEISDSVSDVNKKILNQALQEYKDSYAGKSHTDDCSSYIDKVLYDAGYLTDQNLSSNTTTWWNSATSFSLNGSYKIVEVAEGIGFNTPWYSKDKFEFKNDYKSIMPGDIIIGKTWAYSKSAGDTDFPTVEYEGSTYYAYPSGTGHSMIFLGQYESTSVLTDTLGLSGYEGNISDYEGGADNYYTIYNNGSGIVNIADDPWTATYGSTDATQKNLFAYKVYRIVPDNPTTKIAFNIKKTDDASNNVSATFTYKLRKTVGGTVLKSGTITSNDGTVTLSDLSYSTSGNTTYYLYLKETSVSGNYENTYNGDNYYSTIVIDSSGNVSSWSDLANLTSNNSGTLNENTKTFTYNLVNSGYTNVQLKVAKIIKDDVTTGKATFKLTDLTFARCME